MVRLSRNYTRCHVYLGALDHHSNLSKHLLVLTTAIIRKRRTVNGWHSKQECLGAFIYYLQFSFVHVAAEMVANISGMV
jgi:hypothetical protein